MNSTRTERLEDKMESFESKMDFLINFVTKDKASQPKSGGNKRGPVPARKRPTFQPSSNFERVYKGKDKHFIFKHVLQYLQILSPDHGRVFQGGLSLCGIA